MELTNLKIVLIVSFIIKGVGALLWAALSIFAAKSWRSRIPVLALLCVFVSLIPDIAQFIDVHSENPWRFTAVALQSLFVGTACAAVFKVSPSTWAFGTFTLFASCILYVLAAIATDAHSGFRTGMIVVGGIIALMSAMSGLYARSEYHFLKVVMYFVALAYYIVVLALLIYGPAVIGELDLYNWTIGFVVADVLFLTGFFSIACFIYTKDTADFFNWAEYVWITGRFAPEPKQKP